MIWDTTYDNRFKKRRSPLGNGSELKCKHSLAQELQACGEHAMTRSIAETRSMRQARRAPAKNHRAVDSEEMKAEAKGNPELESTPEDNPELEAAPATPSSRIHSWLSHAFNHSTWQRMAYLVSCLLALDTVVSFVRPDQPTTNAPIESTQASTQDLIFPMIMNITATFVLSSLK